MSNADWENLSDAELWRRFAVLPAATDTRGDCPDDIELAAFLDGRMTEAEVDRFEKHLAGCPTCLAAVRETRAIGAAATIVPPVELLHHAKRLVVAPRRHAWRTVAWWTSTAAAAVVLAVAGYTAGSSTQQNRQLAERKVAEEVSFGLISEQDTDDVLPIELAGTGDQR